jgi:hypothetical protein
MIYITPFFIWGWQSLDPNLGCPAISLHFPLLVTQIRWHIRHVCVLLVKAYSYWYKKPSFSNSLHVQWILFIQQILLWCPWAWKLYHIESRHSSGYSATVPVLRDMIKRTNCTPHCLYKICNVILMEFSEGEWICYSMPTSMGQIEEIYFK